MRGDGLAVDGGYDAVGHLRTGRAGEQHRNHGLFNVQYTEKFSIFGAEAGRENLAVSVNAFYSENAFGFFARSRCEGCRHW